MSGPGGTAGDGDLTPPPRGFARAEFETRTARAQALMAKAGIDVLLLTTEPEVRYFTGFLTRFWESPTRPWFLLLPASGAPVAVIPTIGAALMRSTWVEDIRTWPAPRPEDDGVTLLADTIREIAGASARVGVPMGHKTHLRMPLGDFLRLGELLPGMRVSDATGLIRTLHGVKSEAEIAKIAHACAIAGRAFARVPEIAGTGRPLDLVFREFQRLLLDEGANWVPYLAGGAGPDGYGDVISPATPRPLEPGDVLMLDTGAVFDGYFCDFDRNFAIGAPGETARRAHETLWRATEAGLEAARPGATAAEVAGAMERVLSAVGETGDVGRLGHGLGMRLTEWPSLIPSDLTVLEPGMVITLEPGLATGAGRMMVHEEVVVIREHGADLISPRAPEDLPVIG